MTKTDHTDGDAATSDKNNRAVFLERLGTIYREAGKNQQAEQTFRKMLDLGDDNAVRGYQQIIETYRDSKQWQQATTAAEEAAKRFPDDRGLQMVAASQQADMGDPDPAIARVKALLKDNADDRDVYIALAQMYSRIKEWNKAEESINKAIELSSKPEDKDYALFVAGSIYERQKVYDKAEKAFHKVLADDPKNAMALNYLGYMLANRGTRLDESLGYIRRAVALDPQNGAYLDSLGWVYYKMGNDELAEENLRRAAERMGDDPTIHDHLGELYMKTGASKAGCHPLGAFIWKSGTKRFQRRLTPTASPRCKRNWMSPGLSWLSRMPGGSCFQTVNQYHFFKLWALLIGSALSILLRQRAG